MVQLNQVVISLIEKLKKRIIELERQRNRAQTILQQAVADITAIDGAIQEVKYWIDILAKDEIAGQKDDFKEE